MALKYKFTELRKNCSFCDTSDYTCVASVYIKCSFKECPFVYWQRILRGDNFNILDE